MAGQTQSLKRNRMRTEPACHHGFQPAADFGNRVEIFRATLASDVKITGTA